jgi:D-arabinitol dehydrogenase (NADP+)
VRLPLSERMSQASTLATELLPTTRSCAKSASTAVGVNHYFARTSTHTVLPWTVVLPSTVPTHSRRSSPSRTFPTLMQPLLSQVFIHTSLDCVEHWLTLTASCAAHGLEKIAPKLGSSVLMFGAGPTGLVLSQLLRHNGGCRVVVAAPAGLKMELAKKLGAGDEYVELSRDNPEAQFEQLKRENPYGFDIVVEATGSPKILEDSINYVRRGGKLVVYGVYDDSARVTWPPSKIFGDEITILGSFSETFMFPAAIDYLDSGKVKVSGIVNKVFKLEQWGECLEAMKNKTAIKAAISFE